MKKNMDDWLSQVVNGNIYDAKKANSFNLKLLASQITARSMPSIALSLIMREHYGDSLIFSLALYKVLRNNRITCFIVASTKEKQNYYCVCYYNDNELLLADPTSSVINRKNEYGIDIEDFKNSNGSLYLYDPYGYYGNLIFFSGFLNYPLSVL